MSHSEKCCQNKRGCRWGVGGQQGRTTVNPSHTPQASLFCRREGLCCWAEGGNIHFPQGRERSLRGSIQAQRTGPSWLPWNARFQVPKWIQDAAYLFVRTSSKQLGGKANNFGEEMQEICLNHPKATANRTRISTTPSSPLLAWQEGKRNCYFFPPQL